MGKKNKTERRGSIKDWNTKGETDYIFGNRWNNSFAPGDQKSLTGLNR